jgi:uncharacterized protein
MGETPMPLSNTPSHNPLKQQAVTYRVMIGSFQSAAHLRKPMPTSNESIVAATITWLENIVIGLNLCPFAKAIHAKKQIRFVVSPACQSRELIAELKVELELLVDSDPEQIESTLLIHPGLLNEFMDYNQFLVLCDLAIEELELEGIIQIASFHPHYQFANTEPDDVTNYTNRSPYPTLHLLREDSVRRAIESFPDVDKIYERNIATLNRLGKAKMDALM